MAENTQVMPDIHNQLDNNYPFVTMMFGNNCIIKGNGSYYNALDYDFILMTSTAAVNYVSDDNSTNPIIWFNNKGGQAYYNLYVCNYGDKEWQPLQLNIKAFEKGYFWNQLRSDSDFGSALLAANYDVIDSLENGNKQDQAYNYFVYYDIPEGFSFFDYNGHRISYPLTLLKLISHSFVVSWFLPFFNIVLADPLMLTIFLLTLSLSLVFVAEIIFEKLADKKYKVKK